jgi:hypothetical protein
MIETSHPERLIGSAQILAMPGAWLEGHREEYTRSSLIVPGD